MTKYFLIFFLLFLVAGCKKEKQELQKKAVPIKTFKNEMKGLAIDSTDLREYKDSLMFIFYKMHGFETVWSKPQLRKSITNILSESAVDGLSPEDYSVKKLQLWENKINSLSKKELIAYDVQFTLSVRKYMRHLWNGKLNPKNLYRDWDLKRNNIDINTMVSEGISGDSLEIVFEKSKPNHLMYKRLKEALAIIDKFPKDNVGKINASDKIVRNDTNNAIINIKKRLVFWKDLKQPDTITEIYDRETFKAVKKFQLRHGLSPDGVIGKGTVEALNYTKEQRKQQIIANLERWRWFPRDFGDHYFIVNIPGYVLEIVKDNDTIEEKRIVVGKIERKTPILTSTFNNVVFNPTWTVPPTILKEDLTPSATKNRGYFAKKDITIYNWKGDTIRAEDWKPEKATSYRYVQSPGDHNSLGNVKFNFPNHYTVYLHDTNHRDFFGMSKRSLSSGCVRVQDPLLLAAYMLDDEKYWPIDSINKLIETKKTKIISLKQKIKIHQLYWTAWSENSDLIFRDDIYDLDAGLYKALRK